ncbi:hypothetical protein KQI84_08265 [bacterium]|nr:hypothetical protein [bacterium]
MALSLATRIARGLAMAAILTVFGQLMLGGTVEIRILNIVGFLLGVINPVWSLYALACLGGLFLLDPGKAHWLSHLEALALGSLMGELRLLGRPDEELMAVTPGQADQLSRAPMQKAVQIKWGLWPVLPFCLAALLFASALPGMLLGLYKYVRMGLPDWPRYLGAWIVWGPATQYEWAFKALFNWTTGMGLAAVAARRASPLRIARFMKFGGIGLVAWSLVALLNWAGALPLGELRAANPDPLQAGRLQGTAGHPGWFGQWLVLFWPGIVLWTQGAGPRRRAIILGALVPVALALVLTAARAAWLGAAFAGCVGALFIYRQRPELSRLLFYGLIAMAVLSLAGVGLGGDVLVQRLKHLMALTDRANYYASGLIFLREYPLGVGLGMHYITYENWFTPFFHNFQWDHVTSHSLPLHTLIENGPAVLLLLLGGLVGLLLELRRAWPHFSPGLKAVVVALWMGLGGILIDGVAQYVFYLRVVELTIWTMIGFSLGICRSEAREPALAQRSWGGPVALVLCGAIAVWMATERLSRPLIDQPFDHWGLMEPGMQEPAYQRWMGKTLRVPIDPDAKEIEFSLYRKFAPTSVTIQWPDGATERFELAEEGSRSVSHTMTPADDTGALAPRRWLQIDVDSTHTPKIWLPDSTDTRRLGLYIYDFRIE